MTPETTAHPSFSHEIVLSDVLLFERLKSELSSQSVGEIGELFEAVDEMPSALPTETTPRVLANWIERLKQGIDSDGDYIEWPTI
jgi:hypothetical protein